MVVALSGSGRRWYRYNARTLELGTEKGMIELYGSSFERDYARWEGEAGFSIGVQLNREAVARLAPHMPTFDIQTRHCVWDSRIDWLVRELYEESRQGMPNGALYNDGLSCALLGRLCEGYASKNPLAEHGHLDAAARKLVCEYVEENLGSDLSVTELAEQVGFGPHHFSLLFKRTFGESPYRYVLRRRVEKAKVLLTCTLRPMVEIALELGFSSQSHFTQTFKKQTGYTPGSLRNDRFAARCTFPDISVSEN